MMAGDFTAIASRRNTGGAIQLKGGFVGNKIDPGKFSPASVKLASLLPTTTDPCGKVFFDRIANSDEDVLTTKVDYTINNKQSIFGRLLISSYFAPSDYDGLTLLSPTAAASTDRAYSGVFGHSFLLSNNTVNALRVTVNRGAHTKEYVPLIDYTDIGVKATPVLPDYLRMSVSGGFSTSPGLPTATPTWMSQVSDDLSILHGQHQFGLGANYIWSRYDPESHNDGRRQHHIHRWRRAWPGDYMLGAANSSWSARRRVRRCDPTMIGYTPGQLAPART